MVHDAFPDKHLLFSEGSSGGDWPAAEQVARNVIMDLNNWAEGWTIWNLLLDTQGGPRYAGGLEGDSVVNADPKTGKLTFNPPYYAFGQFTRFIKPGAKRIACTSNTADLIATAFVNPDGTIAVVLSNLTDHEEGLQLWVKGKALQVTSPANGIMTIVL
jgi:glucosylceramidase